MAAIEVRPIMSDHMLTSSEVCLGDENSGDSAEQMELPVGEENAFSVVASSSVEPSPIGSGGKIIPGDAKTTAPLSGSIDIFADEYEFQDDVHGPIRLNRVERDLVDTPEFQRLFRLGQLGFVDLVYPTANHTRGVHSIGACHWAKKLADTLNGNAGQRSYGAPLISRGERALIGIGGLLHDIPHGPFSHDIEKKTHYIYPGGSEKATKVKSHYGPYEKHDDFASNPALYVALMDLENSLLARALRRYSPKFWEVLQRDAADHPHLEPFVTFARKVWRGCSDEILSALLFHLLVYEKPDEARESSLMLRRSFDTDAKQAWGLGPREHWEALHTAWYQPFRHDIIGDTLSADLIDYLFRDQARLGMKNELDLKLLNHYILVPNPAPNGQALPGTYRCAIDLNDHKRGTFRAERLNDIFRLLDIRHQIHEKAVYHRVVQSAIAMLARAGLVLGDEKPTLAKLYGYDSGTPALAGDERFLGLLIEASNRAAVRANTQLAQFAEEHQSLPFKIAERRVYRPLMVIPGDRISTLLDLDRSLEDTLRELAAIVDSTFFSRFFLLVSVCIERLLQHALESEEQLNARLLELAAKSEQLQKVCRIIPKRVIFWTTPYKQLYKDPAILVCANDQVTTTIERLRTVQGISEPLRNRVKAGIQDAETKNEALWKLYVFLSDGLFYRGTLAKLLSDHPCAQSAENHEMHLRVAQKVVIRAIRCAWKYWQEKHKHLDLTKVITFDKLTVLIKLFVNETDWLNLRDRDLAQEVSAVRVSQYLHGDRSPNCRDVRYKFDSTKPPNQILEHTLKDSKTRDIVEQAIRACNIRKDYLTAEELTEVVVRFGNSASELPELIEVAGRNSPVQDEKLRSFWLKDLL